MRKTASWKKAFGKADPAFESAVLRALETIRVKEEKPMKKIRLGVIAAIAAALILATVAYAAVTQWGILDFLNRYNNVEILPEAAQTIQTDVPQEGGLAKSADFRIRQALYDGQSLYVVVEAAPREGILLLGPDNLLSDSVANLGGILAGEGGTIAQYAARNDLIPMQVGFSTSAMALGEANFFDSMDWMAEEGGRLVFFLKGRYSSQETEQLSLTMTCILHSFKEYSVPDESELREAIRQAQETDAINAPISQPVQSAIWDALADGEVADEEFAAIAALAAENPYSAVDPESREEEALSFTLSPSEGANLGSGHNSEPAEFADCGVRVDSLRLRLTPLGAYVELDWTVIDEENYRATEGGLWFEFLDEDGNPLPSGAQTDGSVQELGQGQYRQTGSLGALPELPESLKLQGYNCWTKDRYSSRQISIIPDSAQ